MEFREKREGGVLVLAVSGRLDAETAPTLESALLSRIEAGESAIVLDLASLEYVSSAGLRVVLVAAKRLQEGGGKLVVCSLRDPVLEIFRVSGMDSIVDTREDRAAALAALS